ncbi:MAG: hypothetical protein BGO20_09460 [Bosea sp. 67-29]|nr:MAG: hypothetical protein BGO20_09460 [Bosea sp. 67-29]CAI0345733.1 hypothetical protein BO1005MUT1_410001 [Hyphomicrobiales bacterium]
MEWTTLVDDFYNGPECIKANCLNLTRRGTCPNLLVGGTGWIAQIYVTASRCALDDSSNMPPYGHLIFE